MAAKKKQTQPKQQQKKPANWLPLAAAAILLLAVAATFFAKGEANETGETGGTSEVSVLQEGESLVIPVSELSTTAQFYPVEVNGTQMEIIAVKDAEGNLRTAFNTCQVCYSSGRGYYVQEGDTLVCQNCGNRFTVDQIEVESGGCNPWPIFPENKTVTEESISISYDYLLEASAIFSNWKLYS